MIRNRARIVKKEHEIELFLSDFHLVFRIVQEMQLLICSKE